MLDHTDVFSVPNEGEGEAFSFVKIVHRPVSLVSTPIYGGSNDTVHLPPAADAGSSLGAIRPLERKRTLNGAAVYPYENTLDAPATPPEGSAADNDGGDDGAASTSLPQKQVAALEASTSTNALNLQSPHHKPNIHRPSG